MKRIIHGSLHQATNLELNKLSNRNTIAEIEANPKLKEFLDKFISYIQKNGKTPNAKEMRTFVKTYKQAGKHLPVKPKELKSKTVLYLKALQMAGTAAILALFVSCASTAHVTPKPDIHTIIDSNRQTIKHIKDTEEHITNVKAGESKVDKHLTEVMVDLRKLAKAEKAQREIAQHAIDELTAANNERERLKQQLELAQQAAHVAIVTAQETNLRAEKAEADVKAEHEQLVRAVTQIEKMKPVYDMVRKYWGLGAIAYGVGLLIKHLLILAFVIILLIVVICGLSFAFPVLVPIVEFFASIWNWLIKHIHR